MIRITRLLTLPLLVLAVSACGLNPFARGEGTAAAPAADIGPAPEGCAAQPTVKSMPKLRLPRTETPRVKSPDDKSLEFAQVHTVNRPLEEAGIWTDFDSGWSLLSLDVQSVSAQSIALRLREAQLPAGGEIWLCSPDRRVRQGPYRDISDGELWTPVVPGNEALLQVWVPTAGKTGFRALLADVYGGYR